MMSSYKRIPKNAIKMSDQKIAMNDQFTIEEALFKQTTVDEYVENSKKKIQAKEQEMLEELERNKEKIIEQYLQEAHQTILTEAKEVVMKECEEQVRSANDLYEKANRHYQKMIEETEDIKQTFLQEKQEEIIDFFLFSIQKLMQQEVAIDNLDVKKIYDHALSQITYDTKKMYVRVHPSTYERLIIHPPIKLDKRIEFLCDATLHEADLFIETEREFIDFSIQTQLDELKERLRGMHNDESK